MARGNGNGRASGARIQQEIENLRVEVRAMGTDLERQSVEIEQLTHHMQMLSRTMLGHVRSMDSSLGRLAKITNAMTKQLVNHEDRITALEARR